MTAVSHEGSAGDVCDTTPTTVTVASESDGDGRACRVRLLESEVKRMNVGGKREPFGAAYDSGLSEEEMARCVAKSSAPICSNSMSYG